MANVAATRIPLAEARAVAEELLELLRPACQRIVIAGSIRRQRPDVKDIELVAEPIAPPGRDLFGQPVVGDDALTTRAAELRADGRLRPRPAPHAGVVWGPRYKRAVFRGMALDLFSVLRPAQFGLILAIRTGPAEFSHWLVTPQRQGGMLPDGLRVRDGAIWSSDGQAVATPEEQDVFTALGLEWILPEERR